MKKIFLSIAFCVLTIITTNAQTVFEVPSNVELKTKADFVKYEQDIIQAEKWLEETDLNKDIEKRKNVNAFVIAWISGSPDVSVEVNEKLMKIYGDNHQLLAIYLASYTRHVLENKSSFTKSSANKAAILSMIKVYQKGIDIVKTKEMEKIIKLNDQNKLDEYIKSNFQ